MRCDIRQFAISSFLLSISLLLLTACAPSANAACETVDGLAAALSAENAGVEVAEQIEQPFFAIPAQQLVVNGEDVQVLAYTSEGAASLDAALISADGYTIGTAMVDWIGTPHFFQCGKLIVIYIGDNSQQLAFLERILGEQFAGG